MPSSTPPNAIRVRRSTSLPRAANILRIWRFLPSEIVTSTTRPALSATRTAAGAVMPSSSSTPLSSALISLAVIGLASSTEYVFGTRLDGCISAKASSPSSVSRSNPSESMSRRPTGNSRLSPAGARLITVGRPWVSAAVVTTPAGLFSARYTWSGGGAMRTPSTATTSEDGFTKVTAAVTCDPFTVTLPSLISSSHFRREATPDLAMNLCNLSCMRPLRQGKRAPPGARRVHTLLKRCSCSLLPSTTRISPSCITSSAPGATRIPDSDLMTIT